MKRLDAIWTPYVLAVLVYGGYATWTETGLVAWMSIAQQAVFGSYGVKVSLMLTIVVLLLAGALAFAGLGRLRSRPSDATGAPVASATTASPASAPRPSSQARTMLQVFGAMGVLTWVVGLSVAAWLGAEQRRDNTAVYRPVELRPGEVPSVTTGERLQLRGEVWAGRMLTHRSDADGAGGGRIDYYLVPIVAPGSNLGEPVAFVVRGARPAEWAAFDVARSTPAGATALSLLVRVGGEVGVQARHEFAKMGVVLKDDHHELTIVPSRAGQVIRAETDHLEIACWACAAMSVVLLILGVAAVVAGRRHDRVRVRVRA